MEYRKKKYPRQADLQTCKRFRYQFSGRGGGTVHTAHYFITNDSKENVAVDGSALHGGGAVNSVSVFITNDFNEQFNISGENSVGSGVVASEFIEIKQ